MLRCEKGQGNFINAAARVLKSIPNARFVIVGGGQGSYADSLHAKIHQKFPMTPSPVVVTGYREDIAHVMAALDVVVVPSLCEAQTIVIPQAFAAGKPVIASRVVNNKVERTRPLCPYPQTARYTGTGSINDASNFVCKQ